MSKTEVILFIVSVGSLGMALVMWRRQNVKEPAIRYVDTSNIKTREDKE